jgi:dTDP-4-dehydrorhamnose 3,5-epimerase
MVAVRSLDSIQTFSWAPHIDSRGTWQRIWDRGEIALKGHNSEIDQISFSRNPNLHTLRGLHSLDEKAQEFKAVICLSGRIQDVVVDVRPKSRDFGKWRSFFLSSNPAQGILIPPGFAHGFLTLTENTDLLYLMSVAYDETMERCFRWNDPKLKIHWSAEPALVSDKDNSHPLIGEHP